MLLSAHALDACCLGSATFARASYAVRLVPAGIGGGRAECSASLCDANPSADNMLSCCSCRINLPKSTFSKSQLKKKAAARCPSCVHGSAAA